MEKGSLPHLGSPRQRCSVEYLAPVTGIQPAGPVAGYYRHRSAHETACAPCLAALAVYSRERRRLDEGQRMEKS